MLNSRHTLGKVACALGVGAMLASLAVPGLAAWEPSKPVEFVVMVGKGGGADKAVRLMQSIIASEGLAPVRFTPVNKPDLTGAQALAYLNSKIGDNHTIMFASNNFYITPLRQPELDVDITAFAPIARMAEDSFLLWIHSDHKRINSVEEFAKAAKRKGDQWVMAGTGENSEDKLLTDFLNIVYGLKMSYVSYRGGAEVARALADKKADSTVNNPSEQLRFYRAETTKPLAAFTPNRLPMFPYTPTFRETGRKNFIYFMQRTVVGAPGMSKEAADYYTALFSRVFESARWQDYRTRKSLRGDLLTGDALMNYWKTERDMHEAMLQRTGAIE